MFLNCFQKRQPFNTTPKCNFKSFFKKRNLKFVEIYTDASIRYNHIGIGIWSEPLKMKSRKICQPKINMSRRLKGLLDVNRAELAAIFCALLYVYKNPRVYKNAIICTDSSIALECIKGTVYCEKFSVLVYCIHYLLFKNKKSQIRFKKVKGHSGLKGNDHADSLARIATEKDNSTKYMTLPDNHFTSIYNLDEEKLKLLIFDCLHTI